MITKRQSRTKTIPATRGKDSGHYKKHKNIRPRKSRTTNYSIAGLLAIIRAENKKKEIVKK